MNKIDFLRDTRTKQQYFDDISNTQEIEDKIISRFMNMQGIACEPASPRETLTNIEKVYVSSDYKCDKFGLIEVKFHYRYQEELGFKKYQLLKYKLKNCSILLVNNWNNSPYFALFEGELLKPQWLLDNCEPSSDSLQSKMGGKLDISIPFYKLTWYQLL